MLNPIALASLLLLALAGAPALVKTTEVRADNVIAVCGGFAPLNRSCELNGVSDGGFVFAVFMAPGLYAGQYTLRFESPYSGDYVRNCVSLWTTEVDLPASCYLSNEIPVTGPNPPEPYRATLEVAGLGEWRLQVYNV